MPAWLTVVRSKVWYKEGSMGSQLIAYGTPLSIGLIILSALALAVYGAQRERRAREARTLSMAPLFHAFADEVGRAAEEGTSIHERWATVACWAKTLVSVAALQGLSGLTELSAACRHPALHHDGDPTLYILADNQIRGSAHRLGTMDHYQAASVRFVAPTPTLYAAAAGPLANEAVGTINLESFGAEIRSPHRRREGRQGLWRDSAPGSGRAVSGKPRRPSTTLPSVKRSSPEEPRRRGVFRFGPASEPRTYCAGSSSSVS